MPSTTARRGAVVVALLISTLVTTGCAASSSPSPSGAPAATAAATAPSPAPAADAPGGTVVPAEQVEAARAQGLQVYVSPGGDGSGVVVRAGEPLPQVVVDDMVFAYTPLDAAGMSPSDESIQRNARMTEQVPYREALAEVDVPYAVVYPGMCLGADPVDPDAPGVEVGDPSQLERLRWDYRKCQLDRWYLAALHGVEGADTFQDDMWGFESVDAAVAAVQPYLDANPGLPLVVAP